MSHSVIGTFVKKHEVIIVISLCIIAAIRIFIFCAAFPFFNNVDEEAHFDAVHKYSRVYLFHRDKYQYDEKAARLIVLYKSREYLTKREDFQKTMPLTMQYFPDKISSAPFEKTVDIWEKRINHQLFSPPVYYSRILVQFWKNFRT